MATVNQTLDPEVAQFLSSNFADFVKNNGTNFPISGIAFDASADQSAFWKLDASLYGSGNLTVNVYWYADTATSGDVMWGASLAAITADTDSQDIETKSLATENTATDSHIGTTGQRLHKAVITVSNLDSIAAGDAVFLRIRRLGANAADTMTGDAIAERVVVSYSDT